MKARRHHPPLPRRRAAAATDGARAPWSWALAGALLGLLLTLVVLAPARWLAAGVTRASNGMVQLAEPDGRVWRGSARLVLRGGAGSRDAIALPGRVHWRLWPGLAGVRAELRADCCTAEPPLGLRASPRWGGAHLAITDARSHWPASLLAGLGTPFNTVQPEGEMSLSTRGLSLEWLAGRLALQGAAELTVRQLSSRLSTLRPMGSYRLSLAGGSQPAVTLSTLEGALRLSGSGQWVGSRLRFSGEGSAAPGSEAQLTNLLNLLGRRQGERVLITLG